MRRLFLVRHAATSATRSSSFPGDEPLDERGLTAARALAAALPSHAEAFCSPSLRCRQTAEAAGLDAHSEPRLAECDFGNWSGRSLEEIHSGDPEAARSWMLEPAAAPHGGESLTVFSARVGEWLDEQSRCDGPAAAITHGGVIKAIVVRALNAPVASFWQVDASPLAITELHAHDGRWTISRLNCGIDKQVPA